jgi:hypothetical protein
MIDMILRFVGSLVVEEAQVDFVSWLTRLARAHGGVAHPPNQGEVGAHFHNLGNINLIMASYSMT